MHAPPRAAALAALTLLLLSGCTTPEPEPAGEVTIAPGTTAHLLLRLNATGAADVSLSVHDDAGLDVTLPERLHGDDGATAGWLGIRVPADAEPGERVVLLDVRGAEARRVAVTVTVAPVEERIDPESAPVVEMALRTRDGTVDRTNRAEVDASPLARTETYHALEFGPFPMAPDFLTQGLVEAIWASAVGHSLTLPIPDYHGPLAREGVMLRHETWPRTQEVARHMELDRAHAEDRGFITPETREGDTITVRSPVPYVVERLTDETVHLEVDLRRGERLTFYPAWPDATVVAQEGAQTLLLRTDPPVGEAFTWYDRFPDATVVASLDEENITLRHSPAVGTTYTDEDAEYRPAQTTVLALDEQVITLSHENTHPLAGQTIFLELTVVDVREPPPPYVSPDAGP